MALHFSTLEKHELSQIHRTFLESFADYQVDMSYMTEKVFSCRAIKNGVDYKSSVGVFAKNKMVGFTLIGIDRWKGVLSAFDAATGIVKAYRGQGIAKKMFEFLIPRLKERGVKKFILEVLQDNSSAVQAYKKAGFNITRELDCFELDLKQTGINLNGGVSLFTVQEVGKDILTEFQGLLNWEPSWENSFSSIKRIPDEVSFYAAVHRGSAVGLLVYYPLLNWILTLLVKKEFRRKGAASVLLAHCLQNLNPRINSIKVLNVDCSDIGQKAFLEKRGFKIYVKQYEMEFDLDTGF